MYLEERVSQLENQVALLTEALEKQRKVEDWATPGQLAKTMKVSADTVYRKIKTGQIIADRSTGRLRVPMSQFSVAPEPEKREHKTKLQQLIFSDD
nr:MAG TPA: excisionase [Bacteriophage sp.]